MPVIAPAQSSLRVMPTAPVVQPELFIQQPNPAAGLQMFEQAAKLPLLMEQIKLEKYRQKAEKAKLDLAELTAQKQLESYDQLALQQKALADAHLALTQSQAQVAAAAAAKAGKTPEQAAMEEANAAATQEAVLQSARLGIDPNNFVEAGTGRLDIEGLRQAVAEKTAPLAQETVTPVAAPAGTDVPELAAFTNRLVQASPRAVAVSRFTQDNPNTPFTALPVAEQAKVLAPYLAAAAPKKRDIQFIKDGDKYETTVTESADGLVVYGVDAPRVQSSAPETRATATVKTKLAFLDETTKKIDTLIGHLENYEKEGAFGWIDTLLAKKAQSPETAVPLRAFANMVGNDSTKALASELAGIGAKTMTELAGSAQTKGEAERLGPYVPASTDPVLGKAELKRKLEQFKEQLQISRSSLETQFGMKTKQSATAPAATPAPTAPLDKAISDYLNAP